MNYWILKGEQATWPSIANIKSRTLVEFQIDEIIQRINDQVANERGVERIESSVKIHGGLLKRTKSSVA